MAVACGYHSHSHQSKEAPVGTAPEALQVVFLAWASGFSKSVFPNLATLVLGAMLTTGRRTVSHILLTIGELAVAHPSTYHRILSHRCSWRSIACQQRTRNWGSGTRLRAT